MLELASNSIWAVAIELVLSAQLGFVIDWEVGFHHYLILAVSEAASIAELAVACLFEVLAHFCSEFVDVRSADDVGGLGWIG